MGSVKAEPVGARRVAERFARGPAILDDETHDSLVRIGERSELVFAAHALVDTGRMARGVYSLILGDAVIVRVEARDPETGYDYVAVTRFGHASFVIRPKRAKALRFGIGGATVFATYTRGFHPAGDWRDRALPQVHAEADIEAQRLAGRLEARLA
jgi:hypothetical protein